MLWEGKAVGLMFGSYNPPHLGHLETAIRARRTSSLSEIWLLPIPCSPFKSRKDQTSFENKVEMCQRLARPHQDWLKVSGACAEFQEGGLNALRGFRDVLTRLKSNNPANQFYIVSGADFQKKLHALMMSLSVAEFITHNLGTAGSWLHLQYMNELARRVHNTREALMAAPLIPLPRAEQNQHPVSSSLIRSQLAHHQAAEGLSEEVQSFIEEHGLYFVPQ